MANKLSQFWHELKRRRVIKATTMYAATAFIIMEAADIMLPRLGLPDWTVTMIIILLIVGMPVTVFLSWIFDFTKDGIKKTDSKISTPLSPNETQKPGRAIKISDVVIIILLAAVCILLYPKIFSRDKFKDIRDLDGKISVAVMPFENLSGEPSVDFWQNGISEFLINDLGSSSELTVISSQVIQEVLSSTKLTSVASITPSVARQTAGKIDASTYVTGNYIGPVNNISIMLNLVSMKSGELVWSCRVDGDLGNRYRELLGRLSDTLRNYLEIKAIEDQVSADLASAFPSSAEAYRHYINGLNAIVASDARAANTSLQKAVEIDSSFTLAAFYLAWVYNMLSPSLEEQAFWTNRAHSMKHMLPLDYQNWIDMWQSAVNEDVDGIRASLSMMERSDIKSRLFWFDLGISYDQLLKDYEKAVLALRKVEELCERWNDDWEMIMYYEVYVSSLWETGQLDEMERIAEKGLNIDPMSEPLVKYMGARSLLQSDSSAFAYYRGLLADMNRANVNPEASKAHDIGSIYELIGDYGKAAGYYQKAYELDPRRNGSFFSMIRSGLMDNRNPEIYLEQIEAELDSNPENFIFLWLKGYTLHKLGRNEEALVILNNADDMAWFHSTLKEDIRQVELALSQAKH